jgi:hypothetical protein
MATTQQKVKVAMVFHQESDDELVLTCNAVDTGFSNHSTLFPNLPVDLPTFKAQSALFAAAVVAAKDGGRKAVAEKNKQRAATTKMLSKLARHVTEVADNDLTIVTASGFQAKTGPVAAQPTATPAIDKLVQGNSGEMIVTPTPVAGRLYEIHWGPVGAGGAAPTTWAIVQVATARPGTRVTGLTPGTVYVFQVRAFGNTGWSEWSDPVTKMST